MNGFRERGLNGARLAVAAGSESRTTATAGVRWSGEFGRLRPDVDLGYRHRFGDRRFDFAAAFHGHEDCDFHIVSEAEKRGAVLAGLGVGANFGRVDVRLGYEGLFSGAASIHSANVKIAVPLH